MDAAYKHFSINESRARTWRRPSACGRRQRVLFRILNASATVHRRLALSGHKFHVIAMDGNPLPAPKEIAGARIRAGGEDRRHCGDESAGRVDFRNH